MNTDLITKLYNEYIKNKNNSETFNKFFREAHNILYYFSRSKGLSYEDSEDLLQEYFIYDFPKVIEKYDPNKKRKLKNYLLEVFHFRIISFYQKKKNSFVFTNIKNLELKNDTANPEKDNNNNSVYYKDSFINELINNELRNYLYSLIDQIPNEKHRSMVKIKLCLPFNIAFKELCKIMNWDEASSRTSLSRGISYLTQLINNDSKKQNFSIADLENFVFKESLIVNKNTIKDILEEDERSIFEQILWYKNDIKDISKQLNMNINDIQNIIRNAIFKIFSKPLVMFRGEYMNNRNISQNPSEDFYIESDKLIDFIENYQDEYQFRNTQTTGNKTVDSVLKIFLKIFKKNKDLCDQSSNTLEELKNLNISIEKLKKDLSLDIKDINAIITKNLNDDLKNQINLYINKIKNNNLQKNDKDINKCFEKCYNNYLKVHEMEK